MTADRLEHPETTLVFDYKDKTVELYTTSRRAWLRAIKRNPDFIKAQDLKPGYRILYALKHTRDPELILKPIDGGDDVIMQFLTSAEVEHRQQAADRLKQNRKEVSDQEEA